MSISNELLNFNSIVKLNNICKHTRSGFSSFCFLVQNGKNPLAALPNQTFEIKLKSQFFLRSLNNIDVVEPKKKI